MTAVDTPAPVDETYECTFEFQRGWNDLTLPAGCSASATPRGESLEATGGRTEVKNAMTRKPGLPLGRFVGDDGGVHDIVAPSVIADVPEAKAAADKYGRELRFDFLDDNAVQPTKRSVACASPALDGVF